MNEAEAFGGGFLWAVQSAGDIAFRWIPAAVSVLSGHGPEGVSANPIATPITEPVTPADLAYFLQTTGNPSTLDSFTIAWETYVAISVLVSLLLAAAIIYCVMRILQIRYTEKLRFRASEESVLIKDVPKTQLRWNRILEQVHSDTEQNWRLAILEADIMLNELLEEIGVTPEQVKEQEKRKIAQIREEVNEIKEGLREAEQNPEKAPSCTIGGNRPARETKNSFTIGPKPKVQEGVIQQIS